MAFKDTLSLMMFKKRGIKTGLEKTTAKWVKLQEQDK